MTIMTCECGKSMKRADIYDLSDGGVLKVWLCTDDNCCRTKLFEDEEYSDSKECELTWL